MDIKKIFLFSNLSWEAYKINWERETQSDSEDDEKPEMSYPNVHEKKHF